MQAPSDPEASLHIAGINTVTIDTTIPSMLVEGMNNIHVIIDRTNNLLTVNSDAGVILSVKGITGAIGITFQDLAKAAIARGLQSGKKTP